LVRVCRCSNPFSSFAYAAQEFYHEIHRPNHFMQFKAIEEAEEDGADRENLFE